MEGRVQSFVPDLIMFGRKKKQKAEIDEGFSRALERIHQIDDWDNPKKTEHYILDSCEHIIATTKEIESEKAEYHVLTHYLEDIRKIHRLPKEDLAELRQIATQIKRLEKSRSKYLNTPKLISDEQFILIAENENELPEIILRMRDNERYQTAAEKNMKLLEAKKGEIEVDRDGIKKRAGTVRKLTIILAAMFALLLAGLFYISGHTDVNMRPFFVITMAIAAISAIGLFLWQSSGSFKDVDMVRDFNQTVTMLNVSRMKYANITRALRYQQQKYKVRTSSELEYLYERYMETVKQRNDFERDNSDHEYFNGRIMRILSPLKLYDQRIWLEQSAAFCNEDEMKEVNHNLVVRRKKVREMIKENTRAVKSERDEIDRLMKTQDYYVPEILQIITSVDRLCGL
ncbi:MAG: hypothetical protein K6F00_02080 [Lachnospiraceae bacterium]|nr:hypothetical protein [Lachnospiraceae bacterium]